MKKVLIISAALLLILAVASADLTYLAQYGKYYTREALDAASEAKLPEGIHEEELTRFERELFELGFAAGYEAGIASTQVPTGQTYILNISTKRFHLPGCRSVNDMLEKNKQEYVGTREELIEQGYKPCNACDP